MKLLILLLCMAVTNAFANDSSSMAHGYYSNGFLTNAQAVPLEGFGLIKLFRQNDYRYGTKELVSVLKSVAVGMKVLYPEGERLQVGDLSHQDGGNIRPHHSHQNGLDVDIIYFKNNHEEQNVFDKGPIENFVIDGKLSPNFDLERNWILLKAIVRQSNVARIFVDRVIKKALCDYAVEKGEFESETETLRRLRHWPNHSNHFHLRLKCPLNSHECINQRELREGAACPS